MDMEPVDGSGKGVGEDERAGGGEAKTRAFFGMDQRSCRGGGIKVGKAWPKA